MMGAQLRGLSLPDGSYASAQNRSGPFSFGELQVAVYVWPVLRGVSGVRR